MNVSCVVKIKQFSDFALLLLHAVLVKLNSAK